jgi:hypothetical protein
VRPASWAANSDGGSRARRVVDRMSPLCRGCDYLRSEMVASGWLAGQLQMRTYRRAVGRICRWYQGSRVQRTCLVFVMRRKSFVDCIIMIVVSVSFGWNSWAASASGGGELYKSKPCNSLAYRADGRGAIGSNAEECGSREEKPRKVQVGSEAVRAWWSNWGVGEKKSSEPAWSRCPGVQDLCGHRQLITCISSMRWPTALRINMQQYHFFVAPMLATKCGRGLLVATSTRTVTYSVGLSAQPMVVACKITVHWAGSSSVATMDSWQRSAGQMQPDRGLARCEARDDAAS